MNEISQAIGPSASPAYSVNRRCTTVEAIAEFAGRVLLGSLFLLSGLGKLAAYKETAAHLSSFGTSGALLPLVISTEVLGAVAIILGWKTRVVAFLLGICALSSAFIFLKNVSIAGGFLLLVANGAGRLSIDRRSEV